MAFRWFLGLTAILGSAACSDLAWDPVRAPAELRLDIDTLFLVEGRSTKLDLLVLDDAGRPFDQIPTWAIPPTWASYPSGIVSLNDGEAIGLMPGAARAEVELAGLTRSIPILVNPAELRLELVGAYVTQATQREDRSVPLVAGRDALLRVFLRGDTINFYRPVVQATFYRDGKVAGTLHLERETRGVPNDPERRDLLSTWNARVPGSLLEPGTELVIEADPTGMITLAAGSSTRLPEAGRLTLDVRSVPEFRVRYVLVELRRHGTTARLEPADPMEFSRLAYELFPLAQVDAAVRPGTFASDARLDTEMGWLELIYEILLLHFFDRSDSHYYGVVSIPARSPYTGLGYLGHPVAIGGDDLPETAAHEFGHNFDLQHAPCGGPGNPDPKFPYPGGLIGTFGYSLGQHELFDPVETSDLMSYCRPRWISDYNYMKALRFRDLNDWGLGLDVLRGEPDGRGAGPGADREGRHELRVAPDLKLEGQSDVLVLWGGIGPAQLTLEPAFRLNAPVLLPDSAGPYRIDGFDEAGATLFTISFAGHAVDHLPGARHFVFGVPLEAADFDRLHRIRLSGPEGVSQRIARRQSRRHFTPLVQSDPSGRGISWQALDHPVALIVDRSTGRLLGISRTGRYEGAVPLSNLELHLSDGVRTTRVRLP